MAAPPDVRLARRARSRHGVFHARDAAAAGFSPSALRRYVRSGRAHRLLPNVFAFAHALRASSS